MDNTKLGLITTLLLGLFIIIGAFIAFQIKKKEKVVDFSLGLAFGVIIILLLTHLVPEIVEHLGLGYIYLFLIFGAIGYCALKILDKFIPDHDDDGKGMNKKEQKENLIHIGIVTSVALILHNIIEGMAIYSSVLSDASLGLAMTIAIGFHNIPLGMVIAGAFYQSNENMSKTILSILLVSISTFVGGLIMFFLNLTLISPIVFGILLSITLGMLMYITIDELFPRIESTKNKKVTYTGIAIGVIIQLIALFL